MQLELWGWGTATFCRGWAQRPPSPQRLRPVGVQIYVQTSPEAVRGLSQEGNKGQAPPVPGVSPHNPPQSRAPSLEGCSCRWLRALSCNRTQLGAPYKGLGGAGGHFAARALGFWGGEGLVWLPGGAGGIGVGGAREQGPSLQEAGWDLGSGKGAAVWGWSGGAPAVAS